ncbi:MAG: BamA/TamA family outer membrane protein [Bacteroidetes bacterium]|nr:BamA/TamA family outer membrane protein [Bacteroidota bacterium]
MGNITISRIALSLLGRGSRRGASLLFIAILPLLFVACNPTKKLHKEEYLLNKNFIIDKDTKIDKKDIENYLKQKPNRKILVLFRFHLWLHNQANPDRIEIKRLRFNKKIEKRNIKRIAKGKKAKNSERQLFGEWLLDIGEPPVIVDTFLVKKTAKQIKMFLNNKGYFISTVQDSIHYKKRQKANVYYKINASDPYTFNKLDYKIQDEMVRYQIFGDTANTLILKGNNYDVDIIQAERDRVTNTLNNTGYYLFTKEYIYYKIDTSIGNRKVNITMGIKNYAKKFNEFSDSIVETPHQRFLINNIYIQPDFVSKKNDAEAKDTLIVGDYHILHKEKLKYKTRVLLNDIFIRKGELYQMKNVEDTYKRLSVLKAFKTINIFFTQPGGDSLDCYIQLSPILKQSFTVETEVTNRSGNLLGVSGSFVFQNRNLFKGAEVFELRLKGGVEAQNTFNNKANVNINDLTAPRQLFNTSEFGPELNINIPRFLLPYKVKASIYSNPRTTFTSALNYQRRPDYTRTITNFSFGYTWKETVKKRHTITPLVIDYVDVELQPAFKDYLLNQVQNRFILNSFSPHLSTSTRYSFIYDEQDIKKHENFSYLRINAESSGNILRGISDLAYSIDTNLIRKYQDDRYKLLGIAFSQYLRLDADYRYYYNSSEINQIVFRIAAGIGRPLKNFQVLPFERSFFSGGVNGIRAWQSRTLGPGSYSNKIFTSDQFGDGQLEANIEYRLKLFKIINGAIFVDAGNTWLRQPDPKRPGGDFQFSRFYKEIAIGSGFGIRADFSFFIIRTDIGIKVRDPQFLEDRRWAIQHLFDPAWKQEYRTLNDKKYNFFAFNIGIGYPF